MRNSGIRSGSLGYLHSLREWSLENFSLIQTHTHTHTSYTIPRFYRHAIVARKQLCSFDTSEIHDFQFHSDYTSSCEDDLLSLSRATGWFNAVGIRRGVYIYIYYDIGLG